MWVCVCGGVGGGLSQGRTNAESTNNADTNSTGDPAQEAVPCAWDFTDVLHVMIWRQSLLEVYHRIETVKKSDSNARTGIAP